MILKKILSCYGGVIYQLEMLYGKCRPLNYNRMKIEIIFYYTLFPLQANFHFKL